MEEESSSEETCSVPLPVMRPSSWLTSAMECAPLAAVTTWASVHVQLPMKSWSDRRVLLLSMSYTQNLWFIKKEMRVRPI